MNGQDNSLCLQGQQEPPIDEETGLPLRDEKRHILIKYTLPCILLCFTHVLWTSDWNDKFVMLLVAAALYLVNRICPPRI